MKGGVPAFLFGAHLILMELDVDNILSVLFFAPFAVILTRNVFLLLLRTTVTFLN